MRQRRRTPWRLAAAAMALWVAGVVAQAPPEGWVEVDYGALVDRRQLSHSGEPVGVLLDKLQGRPLPPPGEAPAVRLVHSLLDPLVEPYAFVLSDALDRLAPQSGPPLVEVGSLWEPGEAQPAWVELLRARRLVVESDGAGRMRLCLPWNGNGGDSVDAAEEAYRQWWPVLRSIFDAELRRLGAGREGSAPEPLAVEVHAYLHAPARTRFLLGRQAHRVAVADTRSAGRRPPLALEDWQAFLDSGWQLEGARLEADGTVRLIGSRRRRPPTILDRPPSLTDFAVAYRAVFHGGLAEPYMSLDRGRSPQMSMVSYGGRLRDTALGLVSLLCDIRFKTFSLGLDIVEGRDLRAGLRATLPEFRTHLERFAEDPGSAQVTTQQTRLWFYPDRVDLTVSPQGDLLGLRRVRMSAASERVLDESGAAAPGEDPPWTRATVEAINRDYDRLVRFFPELADLDQVVRLLSLFTWLRQAQHDGLLTPDLDRLLSIELPALPTPRVFPQLLAFNALPRAASGGRVQVFDRVPVAEALARLNPADGRSLSAQRRFQRALEALNPQDAQQAEMLARYREYDAAALDPVALDLLAHRAERLRMHETVLLTLDRSQREAVATRHRAGEALRIFSVGIGGLDLGMQQVLQRSGGRSLLLASTGTGPSRAGLPPQPESRASADAGPQEAWRQAVAGTDQTPMPAHGAASGDGRQHRVERGESEAGRYVLTLDGADGPEVRSRRRILDDSGRSVVFERVEAHRHLRYRLEGQGSRLDAVVEAPSPAAPELPPPTIDLPPGLVLLGVGRAGDASSLRLRLEGRVAGVAQQLEAEVPRAVMQRLVMGQEADLTPEAPLPALVPLPTALGLVETLMVWADPSERRRPWETALPVLAGEEDPLRVARALGQWSVGPAEAEVPPQPTVVGTDPELSVKRWADAPLPSRIALWLPETGFPESAADMRAALSAAWSGTESGGTRPPDAEAFDLLLLVTAETPGLFAARLRELARDPAMQGKLLAAWCLAGDQRSDLAASLLADGRLAGLGLAETSVVGLRDVAEEIASWSAALAAPGGRVESRGRPFLWYF